jgi:hypothetical protein
LAIKYRCQIYKLPPWKVRETSVKTPSCPEALLNYNSAFVCHLPRFLPEFCCLQLLFISDSFMDPPCLLFVTLLIMRVLSFPTISNRFRFFKRANREDSRTKKFSRLFGLKLNYVICCGSFHGDQRKRAALNRKTKRYGLYREFVATLK